MVSGEVLARSWTSNICDRFRAYGEMEWTVGPVIDGLLCFGSWCVIASSEVLMDIWAAILMGPNAFLDETTTSLGKVFEAKARRVLRQLLQRNELDPTNVKTWPSRRQKLTGVFDGLLKQVIATPKGKTKYLSPAIQNELISLIAEEMRISLVSDILKSPYFSIILDSTVDLGKVDQLSLVVRWVSVRDSQVQVHETFLGFIAMSSGKAEAIANLAIEELQKLGITLDKLRGQGFDGASVMSGVYGGVQTILKNRTTNPVPFVHCSTHNLCLVIKDVVAATNHTSDFFDCLGQVFTFVGSSSLRWEELKMNSPGLDLKKLCPTRWSSRHESVRAIKNRQPDIIRLLTKLSLTNCRTSAGLLSRVRTFEFTITLVFWEKLLSKAQTITNMLQAKNLDIGVVPAALSSFTRFLRNLEGNWDTLIVEAQQQAIYAGAEQSFQLTMARNLYRYSGQLRGQNLPEPSKKDLFKVQIFLPTLKTCREQILLRFEGHNSIVSKFACLQPKHILTKSCTDLRTAANELVKIYHKDLQPSLADELIDLKEDYGSELRTEDVTSPLQLVNFIFERDLPLLCPQLVAALMLFIAIPVTVASAERSFSKLKLIKTYLRSTMSQSRLKDLALISIENSEVDKLDRSKLVQKFASAKAGRIKRFH
ncbi:zinc finger MYM-type protein 1-like [Bolinopsis microptera]|uniref:zinc finger MYM-type protein 1-like n=1 Tax=Bolinopsis microptera TaxID=2820187 RepID=UPI00307A402C